MNTQVDAHVRWLVRRDMPEVLAIEHGPGDLGPCPEKELLEMLRRRDAAIAFWSAMGWVASNVERDHYPDAKVESLLGSKDVRGKALSEFLPRTGTVFQSARFGAHVAPGLVVVSEAFHERPSVPAVVGRVLMARHAGGRPSDRAIVIGYKANCRQPDIAVAESMGVEFMTPDEFLDAFEAVKPAPE